MNDIVALILGGGRGARLYPLTKDRSKPAVPIGGKFRLVDLPISNCLHSGIRKILVLTQFNSASLNRHVSRSYHLDGFSGGFIDVMAAEQTPDNLEWFQGTADAVRQSLMHVVDHRPKQVLILSGDHLYKMNYTRMVREHRDRGAPATIAVTPVRAERTGELGMVRIAPDGSVAGFLEKPKEIAALEDFALAPEIARKEEPGPHYAASMGIYLFETPALIEILREEGTTDFGREVIPLAQDRWEIGAHVYGNYWEDIGTIRTFFDAHIRMTESPPPIDFHDPVRPFFTHQRHLPGAVVDRCRIDRSILTDGIRLEGVDVRSSVIGIRSIVREGSKLDHVVMMGADYFEEATSPEDFPLGIGRDCRIERAIIDKNARIGDGVTIEPKDPGTTADGGNYFIRDGITIVVKNAHIAPGTRI